MKVWNDTKGGVIGRIKAQKGTSREFLEQEGSKKGFTRAGHQRRTVQGAKKRGYTRSEGKQCDAVLNGRKGDPGPGPLSRKAVTRPIVYNKRAGRNT